MQKLFLIGWMMFLLLNSAVAQTDLYEKQYFVQGGDTLPVRILTPVNFSMKKKYPLVIFLHGSGERGNDNEKQLFWGGSLFADSANRVNFPAIVVFPQCPAGQWWAAMKRGEAKDSLGSFRIHSDSPMTGPLQLVAAFADSLIASGRVDSRRVYIGGLSMGGMGTFDLIVRRPDLFAAAFPICGGGDPDNILRSRKKLPIWIFHGAADPVVPVAQSRLMVNILREKNPTVRYSEYPGVGHDSWKNAFAEPDLLPWLFSKRKR
jgi:predicted peptidase